MAHCLFNLNKNIFSKPLVNLVPVFSSQFHSHNLMLKYVKYNGQQQAKLAQKFLAKNEYLLKKRAKLAVQTKNAKMISSITANKPIENYHPRLQRLNQIILVKITDIVATAEYFADITTKGFEITQVRCQPGLLSIHVYWYASKVQFIEELNSILIPLASSIRHELILQRVLGNVPPVIFVRDDDVKCSVEVEERLKIADFGPDHEPIHSLINLPQPEPMSIQKEISEDVWKALDKAAANDVNDDLQESLKNPFPSDVLMMKQDVFGVKRDFIMKLVKNGHKESMAIHRKSEENNFANHNTEYLPSKEVTGKFVQNTLTAHSRAYEIRKWAAKYKKLRKEKVKLKKSVPESELNLSSSEELEEDLSYEEFEDVLDYYEEDNDLESTTNDSDYKR